jgi:hypothetical protein
MEASGRLEVYVRACPGGGSLIQVSQDGGDGPIWSPDGARKLRLIRGWVGELEELVPHPR